MPTKEVIEYKNDWYLQPPVGAGDGGNMIRVAITAPATITNVTLASKTGTGEAWTHECPDGGYCPSPYRNPVDYAGTTAYWNGWSNSGENCALFFDVTFDD
jgi:hypothetical protein